MPPAAWSRSDRFLLFRAGRPVADLFRWRRTTPRAKSWARSPGSTHQRLFDDPDRALRCGVLAVQSAARQPGIGEHLVRKLASISRHAAFLCRLSVMHDNTLAIGLYEKLNSAACRFFAIKRKKPSTRSFSRFRINPTMRSIPMRGSSSTRRRRRGLHVEITDAEGGFFRLSHGGARFSLPREPFGTDFRRRDSICDDRRLRGACLHGGLVVPDQMEVGEDREAVRAFLEKNTASWWSSRRAASRAGASRSVSRRWKPLEEGNRIGPSGLRPGTAGSLFQGEDLVS